MKILKININFFSITLFLILLSINLVCSDKKDILINLGFSTNLFPETDARDAQAAIDSWSREFAKVKRINYKFNTFIFQDNESIIKALNDNQVSMLNLPALDYLKIKNKVNLEPVIVGTKQGLVGDNFVILANIKSNIKNIKDLKDQTLCVQCLGRGMVARLWTENLIMKEFSMVSEDFFNIKEFSKESQAVLSVFFNQSTACVVTFGAFESMCELNPQIKKQLKIIKKSPQFIFEIFCISRNLDNEIKNIVLSTSKDIASFQSGKQILKLFKMDQIVDFKEEYIKILEQYYFENQELFKKLLIKHKKAKSK